ncbi:hypothetical protein [Hymenobacter fodinae]|uniref:Uncharacterized protein n=1 Tax=Hymenobacter fodinae TaxID=2510796 RepID=A0A4Z0P2B5_9BACT|nr:hypothetical protein [Hymenobacter fodinae]TGE05493.1 hypothetical protein EU556_19515 [Hymenobacter fodinae]
MTASTPRLWVGFLTLISTALMLISAGLYNGFPLVTSDTGTYLESGIHRVVPDDRPITYGLFTQITSLQFTLWLVIFAQGLLLGWLLLHYVRVLAPRLRHYPALQVLLIALAVWLTGASWFCSQLMPDIFTAMGILALGLLLMGVALGWKERLGLLAITLLAALMHSSNLLTFTLVVLSFGGTAWITGVFEKGLVKRVQWAVTTAVVLAGWLVLPSIHAAFGGGFVISKASPAFLMGRLIEAGIMDNFLSRNCQAGNEYSLCAFRDNLPNDAIGFLWDSNSPLIKTGGWQAHTDEYKYIIREVLTSPRYYPYLVSETVQATLRQLTHIGHGDGLTPFRENTNPYWKVSDLAYYELKEYMTSLQNRGALDFSALNERTYTTHLLAVAVLAGLLLTGLRRLLTPSAILVVVILSLGVVSNAVVTGGLANVLDRLQARVSWVMPFVALLLVVQYGPAILRRAWQRLGIGSLS